MTLTKDFLYSIKNIHFMGIGGSGMYPLAQILHGQGFHLTGSDNNMTSTVKAVQAMGIDVCMGHAKSNIPENCELVVYTAAIMSDNVELLSARSRGIPTAERSEMLGLITRMFKTPVNICGTHGKTTATAMLTQALITAGCDPSAVIGGKLPLIGGSGIVGKSDLIVCEACEYVDTFLKLKSAVSVILNIDADHLEYFKNLDNIIKSFNKFATSTADALIINGDDKNTLKAVKNIDIPIYSFGLSKDCDYRALQVQNYGRGFYKYHLSIKGEDYGTVKLSVPGIHNVHNSLAVIAAAHYLGADLEKVIKGVFDFTGAGRRFEVLGSKNGFTVVDDYAHHPAELKVTLDAAMSMDYNKVWAIFQPFTFSRTSLLFDDFVKVLGIPDKLVMTEIMGGREYNTFDIFTSDLAEKIEGSVWFDSFDKIADYIIENAGEGDLVITLGCGDVYKVANLILEK